MLNTHIGTISFNYGYSRSSNNIFVKANDDRQLSAGGDRYCACFDDDNEVGTIVAFIVCYETDLISIPSSNQSVYVEKKTSLPNSNNSSNCDFTFDVDKESCLGFLLALILIPLCVVASGATWWHFIVLAFRENGHWIFSWSQFLFRRKTQMTLSKIPLCFTRWYF